MVKFILFKKKDYTFLEITAKITKLKINCTITRNVYLRYYTICMYTKFVKKKKKSRCFNSNFEPIL